MLGVLVGSLLMKDVESCSRILYGDNKGQYFAGRSMDWMEDLGTNLWKWPRGLTRVGAKGADPMTWTSKYGSVIADVVYGATSDGMNEVGFGANLLYLAEAEYGYDADNMNGKMGMAIGAYLQYILDMFGTVQEAVDQMSKEEFKIRAPILPNGKPATIHVSLQDSSGDSAILEYLEGSLVIHHGPQYTVMTNSPTYDKQLALTGYWRDVGGLNFLPGTHRAADRFVRLDWHMTATPKFNTTRESIAAVMSMMRFVSVPIGIADPEKPNIATTLWRTTQDLSNLRYFFDDALSPNVFWTDLNNLDFRPEAKIQKLVTADHPWLGGDVSGDYQDQDEGFEWLDLEEDPDDHHNRTCSEHTTACNCMYPCGWSTQAGKCTGAAESRTTCRECPSMDKCIDNTCVDAACPVEYDAFRVCQCTFNCEKEGNCCEDAGVCFNKQFCITGRREASGKQLKSTIKPVASAQHCSAKCQENAQCQLFEYNTNKKACKLFGTFGGMTATIKSERMKGGRFSRSSFIGTNGCHTIVDNECVPGDCM